MVLQLMNKHIRVIVRLLLLLSVCYIILLLSPFHGHGIEHPHLSVIVRDTNDDPVSGVEIVFFCLA